METGQVKSILDAWYKQMADNLLAINYFQVYWVQILIGWHTLVDLQQSKFILINDVEIPTTV